MELKNRRVAIRIDDAQLRWQLSDLLMKKGAVVHRARDEDELQLIGDRLGVEVGVAEARPEGFEGDELVGESVRGGIDNHADQLRERQAAQLGPI